VRDVGSDPFLAVICATRSTKVIWWARASWPAVPAFPLPGGTAT
jgi:hypothetical protein